MMNHKEHTILIVKFTTAMLKSSLCDYSDAYFLVKGTVTVNNAAAATAAAATDNTNKKK